MLKITSGLKIFRETEGGVLLLRLLKIENAILILLASGLYSEVVFIV